MTARDTAISALSPACRARTILAAGSWLPWRTEDVALHAPYIEQDGTPMLLVERATADDLLTAGEVSIESDALPELGVLRLVGSVWPAVDDSQLAALRQFRSEHAACSDCCGPTAYPPDRRTRGRGRPGRLRNRSSPSTSTRTSRRSPTRSSRAASASGRTSTPTTPTTW